MKNMTDEQINETLNKEYSVTLSGAMLGYVLQTLADQQFALNEEMAENITDPMAAMMAAANDVVGNTVLHAIYKAAGAELLAIAMNTDPKSIERLMTSQTPEDVKKAAFTIKSGLRRKGDKLN
jgi:hypothetical protein